MALTCAGFQISAFFNTLRATCIDVRNLKIYSLRVIGAGLTVEASINIMNLFITFDSTRYDANFDPVPGTYALSGLGYTAGLNGFTFLGGDSGNKAINGFSTNIGTGFDMSISMIVIE